MAGRFITLPMVFSRNPETGKRNCGMYRMQVYDDRTTGMHWQTHKQGAEHYRRLQNGGRAKPHGRGGRDRRRPGHHVFGHSAASAGSGRNDDRRLPPRQAGGDGEVRDVRPRSPGQRGDRARRLRRDSANCAPKAPSATTPASIRWPTTIPSFTSPASRSASIRSTRRPSWVRRRWKISTWARPSSAFSCR